VAVARDGPGCGPGLGHSWAQLDTAAEGPREEPGRGSYEM